MDDNIDVHAEYIDDKRMMIELTYDREYFEAEPLQKEMLELYFGLTYLTADKKVTDSKVIIKVEDEAGKILTLLNVMSDTESGNSIKEHLGIYYTNKN